MRLGVGYVLCCLVLALAVGLGGCSSITKLYQREYRPGRTKLESRLVVVPARIIGGHFIVEVKWDKSGPWRFLVDTGSSATLVSPEFSRRYSFGSKQTHPEPPVRVRAADGGVVSLMPTHIKEIGLGEAHFHNVPALVYDCRELSAHFGMKIDGVLSFPLFRDCVFSLDYLQSRLVITTAGETPLLPGSTIAFNNEQNTPLIPLKVGDTTLIALIDSGSDSALVLNPLGLAPRYISGPKTCAVTGTLTGYHAAQTARLGTPLELGVYSMEQPIADLTDQLSSIGGGLLKYFCVTFDPARNRVTFYRDTRLPIESAQRFSTGMSFAKTDAYWRVLSVVPDSPTAAAGIRAGDLISRINGEPVSAWPLQRFDSLMHRAVEITFTFIRGQQEAPVILPVFDLLPTS